MSSQRLVRLECLRGAAAFYVFIHHYVRLNLPGHAGIVRFFPFGQAAVLVFFLLSGFVIHYATFARQPEVAFGTYLGRRARRIVPVFSIALLSTYLASSAISGRWVDPRFGDIALNLLQVQDRAREGNWVSPYLGNAPLWSLSYEWWFYMAYFPIESLLRRRPSLRRPVVLGVAVLGFGIDSAWPNPFAHVASYLVLWWFGVEVARQYVAEGRATLRGQAFGIGSIVLVTLLWAAALWTAGAPAQGALNLYEHPGLTVRHFVTTLALIGVGWVWYATGLVGFDRLLGPFRRLAPFSYALYVMHLPLLWVARQWGGTGVVGLLWVTPSVFALCWLVEGPIHRNVDRRLRRLSLASRVPGVVTESSN